MGGFSRIKLDEVIPEIENWEERAATAESIFDDVLPETENWEKSTAITETFL